MPRTRTRAIAAIFAAGCMLAGPVLADSGITYPIARAATAGQWARWHVPTDKLYDRGLTWPRTDGQPLQGASPDYAWVLERRVEPPDTDRRFRGYACGEPVVALDALPADGTARIGTLTTVCEAPVLPAADLKTAVSQVAEERVSEAATMLGIRSPADLLMAISALERRTAGITLRADEAALLDALADDVREYIAQVYVAEAALHAWIDAHAGLVPDVGPASWPPLPALPEPEPAE